MFHNNNHAFDLVLKYVKNIKNRNAITQWINKPSEPDRFTALHYASFRGNIYMMETLIKNGASCDVKNKFGLNVLHIAAQGD